MRTIIVSILFIGYFLTTVTCELNYPIEYNNHGMNSLLSSSSSSSNGDIGNSGGGGGVGGPGGINNGHNNNHNMIPIGYTSDNDIENLEKKAERYAFGLGRRAYTYTSSGSGGGGIKRLPVYNFGLGKRSRPYSFGLGKRSDDDEYADSDISYDSLQEILGPLSEKLHESRKMDYYNGEKRSRPYSFGLGKRELGEDALERRSLPQRYSFGLGKR